MKTIIKLITIVLFMIFLMPESYAQYMSNYPEKINNLDLNSTPVNKETIVDALGMYTIYYTVDLSDENRGIDEFYLFKESETSYLSMSFNNGVITAFDCSSSAYLIYGNLRVGETVQNLKSMLSNGFGSLYLEEVLDDASKMFNIKLGDDNFFVVHKNDIIVSIHYVASI